MVAGETPFRLGNNQNISKKEYKEKVKHEEISFKGLKISANLQDLIT